MIEFTGTHPFWALLIGTASVAVGTMIGCWHASKVLANILTEDEEPCDELGTLTVGPWT